MFDISFWELAIVGVVALIVIGPERLPGVARTAGHMFGRFQRYVASVRSDIQRELDASEIAKVKQEVDAAARVFETSVQEHASAFQSDVRAMDQALTAKSPSPAATEASALLNAPTPEMSAVAGVQATSPNVAESVAAGAERATTADTTFQQGQLDFGVEPMRVSAKTGAP